MTHTRCPSCRLWLGPESWLRAGLVCDWCLDGLTSIAETFRYQAWAWFTWRGDPGLVRMFGEANPC